jgi:hypothetical protein
LLTLKLVILSIINFIYNYITVVSFHLFLLIFLNYIIFS